MSETAREKRNKQIKKNIKTDKEYAPIADYFRRKKRINKEEKTKESDKFFGHDVKDPVKGKLNKKTTKDVANSFTQDRNKRLKSLWKDAKAWIGLEEKKKKKK